MALNHMTPLPTMPPKALRCRVPVCLVAQSCLFPTPWTVAQQAPLSVKFPKQKHWSSLPFSISGDLPDSGIEPTDPGPPESPALAGGFLTTEPPGKIPPRYKMSGANTLKEQE